MYQVSDMGRVKSLERVFTRHLGAEQKIKERILKYTVNRSGYCNVTLYRDRKRRTYYIHRLVAIAFIPNPLNKPTVNHKDGVKSNNKTDNLEWMTRSENTQHAYDIGLNSCSSRVAVAQYSLTGEFIKSYTSIEEAGKHTGIHRGSISRVISGRRKTTHKFIWRRLVE